MTRALPLLWSLLFYRPLILVLLLLIYAVAALLMTLNSSKQGLAVAAMAALAAAGLSAVLTERISRHSRQAATIGLPDHARVMRRVQACFLVVLVAAPAALACILGANPLATVAAFMTATAAGIALASYKGFWWVLAPLAGNMLPVGAWAQLPPVQALATGVSGVLIWRWFDLARRIERLGTQDVGRLADAAHERRERPQTWIDSAADAEHRASSLAVAADLQAGKRLAAVLALAFGYSVTIVWRALAFGAGGAIAALAAWRTLHGSKPAALAYGIVTAFCCFAVAGRLQDLMERWMRTATEQALLQLTPRWPEARRIKHAVIGTTLLVQRGGVIVWLCASAAAALLDSVGGEELLWGALAIVGTSLASSGALWAVLARRRIREWHIATIAIVLTVAAGVATIMFGSTLAARYWIVGAALMFTPTALALAAYWWLPLRFPLNVDARRL